MWSDCHIMALSTDLFFLPEKQCKARYGCKRLSHSWGLRGAQRIRSSESLPCEAVGAVDWSRSGIGKCDIRLFYPV